MRSGVALQIYCFGFGIGHYGSWVRWGPGVASLFAVREGADWRVQIVWPNGTVHYFEDLLQKRMHLPGLPLMVG